MDHMSINQRINNHVIAFNQGASLIVNDGDGNRWIVRRNGKTYQATAFGADFIGKTLESSPEEVLQLIKENDILVIDDMPAKVLARRKQYGLDWVAAVGEVVGLESQGAYVAREAF